MMRCDLCEASCGELNFEKDGMPYHRCPACGFVFARPSKNWNFPGSLTEYTSTYLDYLEAPEDVTTANHQKLLEWVETHAEGIRVRILDIGCGSGAFVKYLRSKGFDAVGIEPSQVLFDRYLTNDAAFFNETIETFTQRNEKFDVVTMFDVLEHLESPTSVLDSISDILPSGGYLFITTPDVGSVMARTLGRRWHFYNRYHLSMFSKKTLKLLCEKSRMRLLSHKNRGKRFPLGYILNYFLGNVLRHSGKAPRIISKCNLSVPLNTFDILYACAKKY